MSGLFGGAAVGGSTGQLQWNNAGVLAGMAGSSFNSGTSALTLPGALTAGFGAFNGASLGFAFGTNWAVDSGGLTLGAAAASRLVGEAANILAQRNGANAQASRVYNRFIDPSNGEWFQVDAQITTDVFTIGPRANGTGVVRPVTAVGVWTFGSVLNTGNIVLSSASNISINARFNAYSTADGNFTLSNWTYTGFDRLNFGGVTSSFPALKRSAATLQVRLADDSGDAALRARLTTHAAATTETIVPTVTLRLFDSAGVEYRVPALAV